MLEKENETKTLKFHSRKAIGIATFLGGPMAAGYLIRENYLSLNQSEAGKKALIIGIISMLLLFFMLFMIPDSIADKIPNQIIPAFYTLAIYLIVEKIQGQVLNQHKENGNEFYSIWRAIAVGLISMVVMLIIIFGYIFSPQNNEAYAKYDYEIQKFTLNENESLVFYDHLNHKTTNFLVHELENSIIPKWEENVKIIKALNQIENLPSDLLQQNTVLLRYSELRVQTFQLIQKALEEDSDQYGKEIEELHQKIKDELDKLD